MIFETGPKFAGLQTHPVRNFVTRFAGLTGVLAFACWGMASAQSRRAIGGLDEASRNAPVAAASPASALGATWQPVGPNQVASASYGNVTGRVTAIAADPADPTGNTVYVGATGGGVWKSTNAAGPAVAVSFAPLTDTLPVFSPNAGSSYATPSLSIGALSVHSGIVLAGTGDPNDALDSYYGVGILRSADNGVTWTLVSNSQDLPAGNHSFRGLGFAGFAWSDAVPGLVVAAVSQAAEGVIVNAVNPDYSVMGLYYSPDAGVTWHMSTIMDGSQTLQDPQNLGSPAISHAATAVVWNPVRKMFFAAIRYHGYYQSGDGVTWTRMSNQPGANFSLANCPTAPNSDGNHNCPIFRGALAVQPNTGDTFALTVSNTNIDQGLWQDVCSAAGGNCSNGNVTFSTPLAPTSSQKSPLENSPPADTSIPQGDYNLTLAASSSGPNGPGQDTLLFVGTVDLYRCSLAAGCVLRNTTNALNACAAPAKVAPAQHAIVAIATGALPLVYVGNDGGLWRSSDGISEQAGPCSADDANHFQNLNGGLGSLGEVVSFAQSPTDVSTLLVGLGANGSAGTSTSASGTPWPQLSNAEGGTVAIDPTDPLLWYVSTGAGVTIHQCATGNACTAADFSGQPTIGAVQVSGDDSLVDVPWLLDPALPSNVLVGTCRVWRGPNNGGASWSAANAISRLLAGPQNASCGPSNPVVRSIAAAGIASNATAAQNAGSPVLYAGMAGVLDGGGGSAGGHLFSTTTANTATSTSAWSDLAASPVTNDQSHQHKFNPGGFDIASIAADAHDATGATVYATVMGFGVPHVYRSTDAGASWTNISSNLPDAPANAIIVDPNDANTLYVGLDNGVYVTTQVTTCAATNCWSIYGVSLPNAPVVKLAAAANMPTGDGRTGELRAATYGRGVWQIPLVTAAAAYAPAITLAPGALSYQTQPVGTASVSQTVTVTNTGNAPLILTQVVVTGDFSETDHCGGTAISVGMSCAVQVQFLPTVVGNRTGVLTVYGNVPGGQATASLSGTGSAAAAIVLNPIALSFPATLINQTSAVQNITISNTSSSTHFLQAPLIAGADFRITANTCGASLAPSTGCTVAIAFSPKASGARNGMFTITDDAGTQTATLTGTGQAPATDALAPLSVSFAPQQIDTASTTQQVVLTNSGDIALTLIVAQISSGDFLVTNACGNSLNPHSSCAMDVAFAPKNVGPLTGVLTVSDQYRSQSVALSGVGLAPVGVSLAPFSALNFSGTGVGTTSAPQTVTLTNNSGVLLQVQGITVTGDFAVVPGTATCGSTLAAGSACTLQVAFTPTAGGPRSGTLTVSDNAANAPQVLALNGAGVDFTLASNGPASVTIANGQNAVFPLLLTSAANVTGIVSFTCAGFPANSTCTVVPNNVALGNTTTISVTVLTGVSTSSQASRPWMARSRVLWLALLAPLGLLRTRKQRLFRLVSFAVLCSLLAASGCGAGRTIPAGSGSNPPTSGAPTPAGTYTVISSASSAGLTRSVNLTLTVQ
ncbi:MAG: choice-of-anchor D domain-containing protein [Acidobacteriota bacterium]|nr:choice-of-anchor D domain-containing protein [Acidobacteriota bacterium]